VPSIGSHCILELYGCPPAALDDKDAILDSLRQAARRAHSTLIHEVAHRFEPQGVTALALLAESHISLHTWPELGYAACDVFTCGEHATPEDACLHLAEALGAERYELQRLPRGASQVARFAENLPPGEVA
jgi:S-adenosylmethionine decarboxylase